MLYKAGSTLEAVFMGLKEGRDKGTPEDGSWEYEESPDEEDIWPSRHFPEWILGPSDKCVEAWPVEPFIPPDENSTGSYQ